MQTETVDHRKKIFPIITKIGIIRIEKCIMNFIAVLFMFEKKKVLHFFLVF